ncbi:NAD(P)-binding domain-containing protein [Iamia majanohamensis]|uniref:NAD(P)-binding domain-containing protein n=1 Tax=Iamia majanohamensis TaxID=467976 RepID=A0AAE9Y805_9ACTN|nr:NAD(P)-binding domain-containing protein [Iamia majanohamensis]WCO65999.1 NAD(P)-binding domain-containing protein [Iamia majanohamensis]
MADVERVGWVGLGNIGAPMARRLLDHEGGLVACDVVEAATAPFAEAGAATTTDPAEVTAAGATIVSVMVRDDAQVRDVVSALLPGAAPGTVIAVHSTIAAETAEELAAEVAVAGHHLVDAPVSGGAMGAATGRLAVMAGGEADAVERLRVPLARIADLVVRFGPAGAGTRAKIARNLVTFASFAAVAEAQALAAAAGLDLAALGDVVRHSDAVTGGPGSVMIRSATGPLAPDDGLRPIFEHTRSLGEKDLALAVAMGEALDVATPVASSALDLLAAGLGVPHEED